MRTQGQGTGKKIAASGSGTGASESAILITKKELPGFWRTNLVVPIDDNTKINLKLVLECADAKGKTDTSSSRRIETNPIQIRITGNTQLADGAPPLSNLEEARLVVTAIKSALPVIGEEAANFAIKHKRDPEFYLSVHHGENLTYLLETGRLLGICTRFDLTKGDTALVAALDSALENRSEREPITIEATVSDSPTAPAKVTDSSLTLPNEEGGSVELDPFTKLLALETSEICIPDPADFRRIDVTKEGLTVFRCNSKPAINVGPKMILDPETRKKLGKGYPYLSEITPNEKDGSCVFSIKFAKSVAQAKVLTLSARDIKKILGKFSVPDPNSSTIAKRYESKAQPSTNPIPESNLTDGPLPDIKPRKVIPCPDCFKGQGEDLLYHYSKMMWRLEGRLKVITIRTSEGKIALRKMGTSEDIAPYYEFEPAFVQFLEKNEGALDYLRFYSWGTLLTKCLFAIDKKGSMLNISDFPDFPGMDPLTAFDTYAFYFAKDPSPITAQFMVPILTEHVTQQTKAYLNRLPTKPQTPEEIKKAVNMGIEGGDLPPRKVYEILSRQK